MRRVLSCFLSVALAALCRAEEPAAAPLIDVFPRFDGTVTLRTPKGTPTSARVQLHNWGIRNGQTLTSFPLQGLLLMELRAGELTSIIDGERTSREAGSFWIVPERAQLTLITDTDTATLQVTAIHGATP